ncbi:hypothetical protein ACQP3D_30405, partial [Escherichia coli]
MYSFKFKHQVILEGRICNCHVQILTEQTGYSPKPQETRAMGCASRAHMFKKFPFGPGRGRAEGNEFLGMLHLSIT